MKHIYTAPNLDDSRVKNLYLTESGHDVASACFALFDNRLEEIQAFDEISDSVLDAKDTLATLKALEVRSQQILLLAKRTKKNQS